MKNVILTSLISLIAVMFTADPALAQLQTETSRLENQDVFFARISALCGARFEGESVFPADAYTADLIPEAASNEWFLSLSEDNAEITYYLERHNKARFKAILKRAP